MRHIDRLAIVNRGEPAIRALNAVAELNRNGTRSPITTIALYTDPDADAWFVHDADIAVPLGPATYVDQATGERRLRYLDETAVLDAVLRAGADAVWVGWGFLAENASFARRCTAAGVLFVGPDPVTIGLLGDKVAAKQVAEAAGVPVVPWVPPEDDLTRLTAHAGRLGYSLVLKARSGGGGRGIRVVASEAELAGALSLARSEAELAFGDPTVFIERLVPAARHVEVQVMADGYGTVWAVGVRDCTVQRRHQKVLEESGSTVLDPATEEAIRDAAVRVAIAARYRNAGTVEFLVDPDTGRFQFLEVNPRLQVEHPVTEMTTGLDLVKLQLYVASGARLVGEPPPARGYAIEARLCAEDPEQGFAPAPGRLARLRLPAGTGIRVDSGYREGDRIPAEFDSMIAKVVAWGADRDEALARLRRALAQTTVIVSGGTTNRSFLLDLLGRPEIREGRVDNHWLDRLVTVGAHLPAADPVAVLAAAVDAYEGDQDAARAAFHARARRGRPESTAEVGHRCQLLYRGHRYGLRVFKTEPGGYRLYCGTDVADVTVERVDRYERRLRIAERVYRVLTVTEGTTVRVDIDGTAHTLTRDDGGVVRAAAPAFVVSVLVKPGDRVAEGTPLAVLESMKMESTVTAPYAGTVASLETAEHVQVEAGAPLVRLRTADGATGGGTAVSFAGLTRPVAQDAPPCERVYAALRGYLLGFDLDPATVTAMLTRRRRIGETAPPADPGLLGCEDSLLDLFADVGSLCRPRTVADADDGEETGSTQEYLLAYLQWLDADRAGLPESYRRRLERALLRYGVSGLERSPELEDAVVWMFRSFRRVDEFVPVVASILQRRLRHHDELSGRADLEMRTRLDRLAAVAAGRYPLVAELARDVRYRYLDEPLLAGLVAEEYAAVERDLTALAADPGGPDRAARIDRLVACPQPLRPTLLRWWRTAPAVRQVLLEVHLRRFYRIRDLRDVRADLVDGHLLGSAEYDLDGVTLHVVAGYAEADELPALARATADRLRAVPADRPVVVDLALWRHGPPVESDAVAAELEKLLADADFGRPLRRLDVTVTTVDGPGPERFRTHHVTYRQRDGQFVEDPQYRNLHPMLAKRLELWRLSNFELRRLRSAEDVYVFHGVAHGNPADHRLFALAEVRDLTATRDAAGAVRYPRLELMGLSALAAIREALVTFPERERPAANRIVLYVRPPWLVPAEAWPDLAASLASLAAGAGLEKVVLRVRRPDGHGGLRDTVLHVEGLDAGVTVRERPPGQEPVRPLSPYRQKLLRARRTGAPYPYEIVRMLTPPPGSVAGFPVGRFTEYDLDDTGALVPVSRPYGLNASNIVVGVLTNETAEVPEGMSRVALFGDPTRGLGNLAEAECRRIIAALDLAERLRVPLEWFALSSGARIAMDSGTENMDWIAAVLRRLIEFTQGGGEVNVVVTGVNVGAQPYWNAEATMLMHTRGILVMTPASAMVLTGKQALDVSGGVSADDNFGIGGFDRIMGPNGQGQYWAGTLGEACDILLRHYAHTYVVPGERFPRRALTTDPVDRDVCAAPHPALPGSDLRRVGDVFSEELNGDRKKPFDMRAVLRAVTDADAEPLERWARWRDAETVIVWDAHIGGIPVCLVGIESQPVPRRGFVPAGGPTAWTAGTLFPQSSRKLARAVNAASGNRPLVVLANLSGFDGSPESMRRWQLEYGAEIGRAVTNFRGPIVFVVVSRYHGGAFVVFSKTLNESIEVAAVEGSFASVIGGAPAAATVFAREVKSRTEQDPAVRALAEELRGADRDAAGALRTRLAELTATVRAAKLREVADEFDRAHSVQRALSVGSIDRIIAAPDLRPYVVDALERGLAREAG